MMNEEPALMAEGVGRIVQNRNRPLVISPDSRRISAFISESEQNRIRTGMFLIATRADADPKFICRVTRVTSYPQSSSIVFRGTNEFVTEVEMDPLGRLEAFGTSPVSNVDLSGYSLRRCEPSELARFYQLPEDGIAFGNLVIDESQSETPFKLPVDLLYRSTFICGAKGSGKTTCLRETLPKTGGVGLHGAPAIIILDVEGEFSTSGSIRGFESAGFSVTKYRLANDPSEASATLGVAAVHYEDFAYFAPNLPLNSMLHLESIVKELLYGYKQTGRVPRAPEMLADIQRHTWRRSTIHHFQRDAIIRATSSDVFGMFDQPGVATLSPEELVRSRCLSVLDVSSLTDDQQRVVALYLLSTLVRHKNQALDSTGTLLIMDEAQKLFPHKGELKPEYAERLGKFVEHIVHRGRRRRFGVVLATQYPADVSRIIADLCDNKFIFRMAGPQAWLKETLGERDLAAAVPDLAVGQAFVVSTALNLSSPVRVAFPPPQAPNSPAAPEVGGQATIAFPEEG
jgi:DNA helicase HerA-like ATPase